MFYCEVSSSHGLAQCLLVRVTGLLVLVPTEWHVAESRLSSDNRLSQSQESLRLNLHRRLRSVRSEHPSQSLAIISADPGL